MHAYVRREWMVRKEAEERAGRSRAHLADGPGTFEP